MRKNFGYKGKIPKKELRKGKIPKEQRYKGKKDKSKFFIVAGQYRKEYLCLLISSRHYDDALEQCITQPRQLSGLIRDSFINVHGPRELEESDIGDVREIQQLEHKLIEDIKRVAKASPRLRPPYKEVISKM